MVVTLMPRWLKAAWLQVITTTARICCQPPAQLGQLDAQLAVLMPKMLPRIRFWNSSQTPTSTEDTTKIRPSRLTKAVAQPQPRPPRIDDQWYNPPAVG